MRLVGRKIDEVDGRCPEEEERDENGGEQACEHNYADLQATQIADGTFRCEGCVCNLGNKREQQGRTKSSLSSCCDASRYSSYSAPE